MHAVCSALQVLFKAQPPTPSNGTTTLSMKDIVADSLARHDYDHDCNSDCMAAARHKSDSDSTSDATLDDEPCKVQEEALAPLPRCIEHDTSTLLKKYTTSAGLTSCNELQME